MTATSKSRPRRTSCCSTIRTGGPIFETRHPFYVRSAIIHRPWIWQAPAPRAIRSGNPTFSRVMHGFHGLLLNDQGGPLFPPNGTLEQTCYQCHPGKVTQCQRGAMRTGGMGCHDCHGDMLAVGGLYPLLAGGSLDGTNDGGARRPWQDLPRCQSCHTGDAVSHLQGADLVPAGDSIRLRQAYRTGDPSASPLLATNTRFAENPSTLYRFSKGHSGILCEGCHGSTHAEWPNADPGANDNIAATQLQGHPGPIIECSTCHAPGTLVLTLEGPHGLHNVNDPRWSQEHGDRVEAQRDPPPGVQGLPRGQPGGDRPFQGRGRPHPRQRMEEGAHRFAVLKRHADQLHPVPRQTLLGVP